MGFVGDMFSSKKGAGFQASGMPIESGLGGAELLTSSRDVQDAMDRQRSFVNALNQQQGITKQTGVFDQQQALANQLGLQAQGQGPNPALQQLANTTGSNIAQQAALMGSQRGSSANAGLIGRQAAMQGGAAQQQASGQAALMRAQQQLAAQQALQNQQGMMGGLSTQMVGQQANATNALNQAAQARQQMYLNAQSQLNQAQTGMQGNMNSANAGIAGQNAKTQGGMIGGLLGGVGGILGLAHGGSVPGYADGGMPSIGQGMDLNFSAPKLPSITANQAETNQPQKSFASGFLANDGMAQDPMQTGMSSFIGGLGKAFKGKPEAPIVSGGGVRGQNLMAASGGKVNGKAEVSGDSERNDKVPAYLSPKEIVLPRSVTMAEDAPDKAAKFVAAILAKENLRKRK